MASPINSLPFIAVQGPVVQKVDNAIHQLLVIQTLDSSIHRINHYPVDSANDFPNTNLLDSDLSGG